MNHISDDIDTFLKLANKSWQENTPNQEARQRHEQERADRQALITRARLLTETEQGFSKRAVPIALNLTDTTNPAIQVFQSWDPTEHNILVVSGPKGCGKTVAATWWALRYKRLPKLARATTFAATSRYGRGEQSMKAAWLGAPAMVLDDLGAEYADNLGSILVDLDELVDVYYSDNKPLVITTNCTAVVFKQRYGERIVDRIRECGTFCEINAPSLRGKPQGTNG